MTRQKCEILLPTGEKVLVSQQDHKELNRFKWYRKVKTKNLIYAIRLISLPNGKSSMLSMHRQIMGFPEGKIVHHINSNGLDNRRENLAVTNIRIHQYAKRKNSISKHSRFKGVFFRKQRKKFCARIYVKNKYFHLGSYDNEADAALAYDRKVKEVAGRLAGCNFKKVITQKELLSLLKNLKARFAFIIYRKADGSVKNMIIKCYDFAVNRSRKMFTDAKEMPSGGWKRIRLDRILAVKIKNAFFYVKRKRIHQPTE